MAGISYLGPPGTFSHQAALVWSKNTSERLLPCPDLTSTVEALERREVGAAVVPLENSSEGSVNLTLDLLLEEAELVIQGEIVVEVSHNLVGTSPNLANIRRVYSHHQALAQCRGFLRRFVGQAEVMPEASTARAAQKAAQEGPGSAALSSRLAAELWGLDIIRADVQDQTGNKTRFVVLGRGEAPPSGEDKTSLVVALPRNRPGGLFETLKEFAEAGIDLSRIESRPTKQELGEYLFFLDCAGHRREEPLRGVLERLQSRTALLRVLGSYPQAKKAL